MNVFPKVFDCFSMYRFRAWFASLGPKFKKIQIRQLVLCIKMARRCFQDGPKRLKIAPRWSQEAPKRAQDGLKMVPRGLMMAPRIATRPQEAPRWSQKGSNMAQDGSKLGQEEPRWPQVGDNFSSDPVSSFLHRLQK